MKRYRCVEEGCQAGHFASPKWMHTRSVQGAQVGWSRRLTPRSKVKGKLKPDHCGLAGLHAAFLSSNLSEVAINWRTWDRHMSREHHFQITR